MSINKETYREPLTDMVIDSSNLDKWKKKLNYVTRVNDNLLLNLDIKSFPKDVTRRKELYFEKIKLFIAKSMFFSEICSKTKIAQNATHYTFLKSP